MHCGALQQNLAKNMSDPNCVGMHGSNIADKRDLEKRHALSFGSTVNKKQLKTIDEFHML